MKRLAIIAALSLAACATTEPTPPPVAIQPVTITVDTLCLQKKRTWESGDTPETVREAVAFNKAWDAKCAKKA